MIRNSILYRRLWYVRRRNAGRIHVFSKLIVILVILTLIASFTERRLMPSLVTEASEKAQAMISLAVNDLMKEKYPDISYEDLAYIERDAAGNIVTIQMDMDKQIEIEENAANALEHAWKQKPQSVGSRLGVLLGGKLSDFGPLVKVKIHQSSIAESQIVGKFFSIEENRTVHKIYIKLRSKVLIEAPMNHKTVEISKEILLTESTITGHFVENDTET